ncbi:hypothetical protein K461DRAFT_272910 [Myriangium duriaei CBS 260.36]|uniref:ATP-grasp domain-containing protein n=1 Tax=Myriangium duriaei CBS 260.36 TaxID=1168546 RepID=A0A9P4JBZ1_9PEZI|nr:hypothetical protein K461DRAFT_272910 [Myriangium duriaei CBS 260.36]
MLGAESSRLAHGWQNLQLLTLSLAFLPLDTFLLFLSIVLRPFLAVSPAKHRQHVRSPKTPYLQPRTILVTGVGMTKGLTLARLFYAAGHNVIGADFDSILMPSTCGRYSRSLRTFHRLEKPDGSIEGSARYAQSLLDIIRKEKVDLWVSCSGVASALDDGKAKEMIELITPCKAVQFDVAMTQKLHEKHSFMDFTKSIGLQIPDSHHITSPEQALRVLADADPSGKKFVMKFTGTDDSVRGDMTLLPLGSPEKTAAHIKKLPISKSRPWILQQFISGPEYCTHALVINNKVVAFTACPSSELLMYYTALAPDSVLSRSMLNFTRHFASSCPEGFTGHLSFDFMVDQDDVDAAKRNTVDTVPLWPIECNPRAHTAVVLFSDTPEMISQGYMTIFNAPSSPDMDAKGGRRLNGSKQPEPVYPVNPAKYYWLPHDLVTLVVQPVLALFAVTGPCFAEVWDGISDFVYHILTWRDGTFELWDPVPAWVLWHVSWPWIFLSSLVTGHKWSRVNVSTMKVFGC